MLGAMIAPPIIDVLHVMEASHDGGMTLTQAVHGPAVAQLPRAPRGCFAPRPLWVRGAAVTAYVRAAVTYARL